MTDRETLHQALADHKRRAVDALAVPIREQGFHKVSHAEEAVLAAVERAFTIV